MEIKDGDMKMVVDKLEIKPGQIITINISEKMKVTKMGQVIRFAQNLSTHLPNNPIAIITPDFKIGLMEPAEYEKLDRVEEYAKRQPIEGQMTFDDLVKEGENG